MEHKQKRHDEKLGNSGIKTIQSDICIAIKFMIKHSKEGKLDLVNKWS